jgi:hypothetical protein
MKAANRGINAILQQIYRIGAQVKIMIIFICNFYIFQFESQSNICIMMTGGIFNCYYKETLKLPTL